MSRLTPQIECAPAESAILPRRRFKELDGIRGWAALSVVAFHIFWETFGVLQPGFRNPISAIFLNSELAVAIFFVLSGEALSAAYFSGKGDAAVAAIALKRYFRLTIPIFTSCAFILVLMRLNMTPTAEASVIIHRPDWLGRFLANVPASPAYFLRYALFDVYTKQEPEFHVNPFLWTMHFEMIGSILVFTLLFCFRHVRYSWPIVTLLALTLAVANGGFSNYACFLFGIGFSAARAKGILAKMQGHKFSQPLSWLALLSISIAAGLAHLHGFAKAHAVVFAVPLLTAIFTNHLLVNFFSSKFSRLLGAISFPIYLIQFPVIASFTSSTIIYAERYTGLTSAATWSIAISSMAICILGAIAFLPVETLTRNVGNRIARTLIAG